MSRRTRNWVLMVAVLVFIVGIRAATSRPITPTPYFDGPTPLVIAHQGGAGLRPGNTLLAFQHARALGADVLEMDVRATRDGTVVLMHDATVDRTTNGSGAVAGLDLAALRMLDAGYHWPHDGGTTPYRGKGVRVPTLAEVLERFPDMRLNVEIKQADPPILAEVCELLRKHRAATRTLVASFDASTIRDFRAACPEVATTGTRAEVVTFYLHHRLGLSNIFHPEAHALQLPPAAGGFDLTTAPLFRAARERGMHVDIWTVNERELMRTLVARGVGGIITDRPDLLLEVLGRAAAGR